MRHSRQALVKSFLRTIEREAGELEALADDTGVLERLQKASVEGVSEEEIALAESAVRKAARDQELSPAETWALEAIVLPTERPVVDVVEDSFGAVEAPFAHLADGDTRKRIERAIPAVGRIDLPDRPQLPFAGTGFVVGEGLLMTNRHVAALFAQGLGRENLTFLAGQTAEVDFRQEIGDGQSFPLAISRILMVHPYWDMALLAVDGLEATPLELLAEHPSDLADREVAVIGYPAFDERNDAELQMRIFRRVFNVKRLQPGRLRQRADVFSFGNSVSALTHDSSTLGGNSGSAVIDVETGQVIALHFAGRYLEANYAVPMSELARDRRVHQAGVPFVGSLAEPTVPWEASWRGADPQPVERSPTTPVALRAAAAMPAADSTPGSSLTLSIPLEVTVRLGTATLSPSVLSPSQPLSDALERMVEPFHEDGYDGRPGYDDRFLGPTVPPPEVRDLAEVSRLEDGGHLVPYEHFSLVLHKGRRLPVFTAANVDGTPTLRRPDPTKRYTRKALSGLGDNDQERWFVDPRLRPLHQLPDRFFTKDRGSFDKGHLVRREAVAWGKTYDELRRANGDTYHVTNCSPQVGAFNRSNLGGLWGRLENLVLEQSKSNDERYSVFAGPILDDQDPVFHGVDDVGKVTIRIPRRYWKLIVARDGSSLASFAFLLEQDLAGVDLELAVDAEWRGRMVSVADLEAEIDLLDFPEVVHRGDQFATASGESVRAAARQSSESR